VGSDLRFSARWGRFYLVAVPQRAEISACKSQRCRDRCDWGPTSRHEHRARWSQSRRRHWNAVSPVRSIASRSPLAPCEPRPRRGRSERAGRAAGGLACHGTSALRVPAVPAAAGCSAARRAARRRRPAGGPRGVQARPRGQVHSGCELGITARSQLSRKGYARIPRTNCPSQSPL
jgi:hypothetical protein